MDYKKLASQESIERTKEALEGKGYSVVIANNKSEALESIKQLIRPDSSVMNGSSVTLEQIGYIDLLSSGNHPWRDLHAKVRQENDATKRAQIRRESVLSDYYLGSVHALIENGEFIIASNTGSQLPHVAFTSPNLIFVVSVKKIVPDFETGMKRLTEYVVPLEDKHMQSLYGIHTGLNKILIFKGEAKMIARKVHFILVKEDLGF